MMNSDLILINPPTMLIKPDYELPGTWFVDDRFAVAVINPGIISIASYLVSKNFSVKILDFQHESDFEVIRSKIRESVALIYGISSTSGFDYLESLQISHIIKEEHPDKLVITGGQHTGVLGARVFETTADIDVVVKGDGELITENLLNCWKSKSKESFLKIAGILYRENGKSIDTGPALTVDINKLPGNDFTLFPEYSKFTPFVEESRGCASKCSFCANALIHRGKISIKSKEKFYEEVQKTVKLFGPDKDYALLAANFGLNSRKTLDILDVTSSFDVKWNTEMRADNPWEDYIDSLAQSNVEALSVGFESANPKILTYMNKTKKPQLYIQKTKDLLDRLVGEKAIDVRLNIMFFLGETPDTARDTLSFLVENQKAIGGILASPVFLFENTPAMQNLHYFREKYGTELVDDDYWRQRQLYPIHPSSSFSFHEIVEYGNTLEKIFSNPRVWIKEQKYRYIQESRETKASVEKSLMTSRFGRKEEQGLDS